MLPLFNSKSKEKSAEAKHFGDISEIGSPNKKSKAAKGEDYYVYWKNKAFEYLETNMKLMNEVRRLTR